MDRFIGLRLDGRYEITELIGVGGMADVYKGRDIMENRVVAVKILKSEYSENEEFVRRFRNESKAIAVLSHPNIVKIYDVGYEHNMQYIVMEYIDGITLKEYIEQQGMVKWRDCVHFTIQILRALQLAHDRGIIHRDIKPQNVMLLSDGSIKVMDFGIATFSREVENNKSEKTMGSVHYVSPEQARGSRTDERSDIYSVGVMMYEMLTGRKPFNGDTPVAVALKHMHDAPVPPSEYVSSIYQGLEEIILHAMEKDPARRYQSASEMIRDIEQFKTDQSISFGYFDNRTDSKSNPGAAKEKISGAFSKLQKTHEPKQPKPAKTKPVRESEPEPEEYEEYYDDDDDDYVVRHNYALPILAAVTVTVIIVATLFVANVILGAFKTTASSQNDFVMPNLIGMNFYDARSMYPSIQLVATEEYNSEYAAGLIVEQEKAENRLVKIGDTIKVTVSKGTRMVKIMELKNYHYSSATRALEDLGLKVTPIQMDSDDIASGFTIKTDPAAGSEVEEGTTVRLYISLGPSTEDTTVPYVVGKDLTSAQNELSDWHLTAKVQYMSDSAARDTVISQNIEGGSNVPRDTVVTIYVSDGSGETITESNDQDPWSGNDDLSDPWTVDPNNPWNGNYNDPDDTYTLPQIGSGTVTIDIDIPYGSTYNYFISLKYTGTEDYVVPQFSINGGSYAGSSYPVELTGQGEADITAFASMGITVAFAEFHVNFDAGTYEVVSYDAYAFRTIDSYAEYY